MTGLQSGADATDCAPRRLTVLGEDREAATAAVRRGFGGEAPVRWIEPAGPRGTTALAREFRAAAADGDAILLFTRAAHLGSARFLWSCAVALTLVPARCRLIAPSGSTYQVWQSILRFVWPLAPLLSVAHLILLPLYLVRRVVPALLAPARNADGEIVGYGYDRGVGGQIYWLIFPPKVRRYGLFGLAHDTYMGMPLGIHSWPLSVLTLTMLGYRGLYFASTGVLAGGAWWLFAQFGHGAWGWLIPLALCSNYYLFNLTAGTWETLAWAIAVVMLAAVHAGMPIIAGVFGAALLLCHPGITLLQGSTLLVLAAAAVRPLPEFVVAGEVAALLSAWWLVPYLRARAKLGRGRMLAEVWQEPMVWSRSAAYQFAAFALFAVAAVRSGHGEWSQAILVIPLIALYVNTRRAWVFSQYTLMNYMLVIGLLELSMHPSPWAAGAYLLLVFTPASIIWEPGWTTLGVALEPIRLGRASEELKLLVADLAGERIAFELGRERAHPGWSRIAAVSYILADSPVELATAAYTEIGDFAIYARTAAWFNTEASIEELRAACECAGVSYALSITDPFRDLLLARGFEMLGSTSPLDLSDVPGAVSLSITLFRVPWPTAIVDPPVLDLVRETNRLEFTASAGTRYLLRYSAFAGWRASQDGHPIALTDARPGMTVEAPRDGRILLQYSLAHYFRR